MKIVVINPNSSEEMTRDIRKAAESYVAGRFEVLTLPTPGASKFIGTFEDMAKSAPGMCEIVRRYEGEADAFVVACGRDPNLKLMRELTDKPVVGIAQASFYMASMLGNSFTILQTDSYTVPNKIHVVHDYHMESYLASVRDASVEGGDRFTQYLEAGRKAIAELILLDDEENSERIENMTSLEFCVDRLNLNDLTDHETVGPFTVAF